MTDGPIVVTVPEFATFVGIVITAPEFVTFVTICAFIFIFTKVLAQIFWVREDYETWLARKQREETEFNDL